MAAAVSTPHEPTDACRDDHCWFHSLDEPCDGDPYLDCPECLHRYVTEQDLIAAFWASVPAEEANHLTVVTGEIFACPYCAHDF